MSYRTFQSKPQRVEAVQWTGDNYDEVARFMAIGGSISHWTRTEPLQMVAGKRGDQGWVPVPAGHWIVRLPCDPSDHWPVDPDYFSAKYVEVLP